MAVFFQIYRFGPVRGITNENDAAIVAIRRQPRRRKKSSWKSNADEGQALDRLPLLRLRGPRPCVSITVGLPGFSWIEATGLRKEGICTSLRNSGKTIA